MQVTRASYGAAAALSLWHRLGSLGPEPPRHTKRDIDEQNHRLIGLRNRLLSW